MFNQLFESIISLGSSLDIQTFLVCLATALVLGFVLSSVHMLQNTYTKGFVMTLSLLPASVSIVISMVNGNVGTGVAIAGAFSLVRFRSQAGTSREINAVFLAMAIGLACGMGYIGYAVIFTILISLVTIVYVKTDFGNETIDLKHKVLKITIPENLNYTNVFEDIFENYLTSHRLITAKTSNMGTMYKLTYEIELKDIEKEKEFIDLLRVRNANLEISSTIKQFSYSKL